MEILGLSSEEAMVAAYLRAEIDSLRYRDYVLKGLRAGGKGRKVVDSPDLSNSAANVYRQTLLDYRGFRMRKGLFEGFPRDLTWHKAVLGKADFKNVRYLNNKDWWDASDGTHKVQAGAANLDTGKMKSDVVASIKAVTARLDAGETLPEIILAGTSFDGKLVLVEGHARSTAFLRSSASNIDAIVGLSPAVGNWIFY